jgi:hypothetical protein
MSSSMTQNQNRPNLSKEMKMNDAKQPADEPITYRSDADMSEEEIILGLMEISALSLPDEPYKYYSSNRICARI